MIDCQYFDDRKGVGNFFLKQPPPPFFQVNNIIKSSEYHKPSGEELGVDGDGKKYDREDNSF